MNKKQKKMLIRIIIAAALMIALHFAYDFFGEHRTEEGEIINEWAIREPVWFILYMIPYLVVGYDILRKAFKGILNRQVFDENFLMVVATVGAIAVALVEQNGDYTEAIAVMLFYQTGELFQSYAVGKSRRNISALMDIRPDHANIEQDGELVQVDPDEVEIGTVVTVKPGEKIPIDGIITEGRTTLNTSALTGESLPREAGEGDEVISGCINMTGVIKLRTTKEFGESTVSKILELVENSSSRKSKSEDFISRFAKYYTPAVCGCALALAILPPLFLMIFGKGMFWGQWIYRALTFLVISCPCALVISIPLTFFAGIGGAGNAGILVKGSNYLEALSKTGIVAFDKTGTMTKGVFEVKGVHHSSIDNAKLLEYTAHAECMSSHPIAKSIIKTYQEGVIWKTDPDTGIAVPVPSTDKKMYRGEHRIMKDRVGSVEEIGGNGIVAIVDGREIVAGNRKLMDMKGIEAMVCHYVGTVVHVAVDGEYAGHILISDVNKPTAREAVAALKKAGVRRSVMLTGDSEKVAESVAAELGIDEVKSELLPEDKVKAVEELLADKKPKEILAFVGDGINDAPVLSRADIGIAMGALGSDAAIEAADIVLMDDDPAKIAKAIRISRKCMTIVYENIYFAIGIKLLCLILGAFGIANMWMAIFADVGVMVLAVINAIRALFVKKV
ncbi:MAG: heavy metal translocating P-type ATPase [Lachnospiraceae bacterium]|nr:heavy metal translocating P-type ATPase [Lachnospiraceae bacterium]